MARYLRYAAAVVFALLAAGFVALWARSQSWQDWVQTPVNGKNRIGISSHEGTIYCVVSYAIQDGEEWSWDALDSDAMRHVEMPSGFKLVIRKSIWVAAAPHWFLAASSLAVAALLGFKPIKRFTVRGLLITTTVVAALLGALVYAV